MKKTLLPLLLLFMALKVLANPIALPQIEISELYFDPDDGFKIEIKCLVDPDHPIDSIWLHSSQDKAKVKPSPLSGDHLYLVITPDSLQSELYINKQGDKIKLIAYAINHNDTTQAYQDSLLFGNYYGSKISSLPPGHSIARAHYQVGYNDYYTVSLDKSPSLGAGNDTSGMCGTVYGKIYDREQKPVTNRKFAIHGPFETDQKGRYRTRLFSNHSQRDYILYQNKDRFRTTEAEPYDIDMTPDEVIHMDIYLLDTLAAAIQSPGIHENSPVRFYPNPAHPGQSIHYECDMPVRSAQAVVEVLTLDGAMLLQKEIREKQGEIHLPAKLPDNLLMLTIRLNGEILHTSKIVMQHL